MKYFVNLIIASALICVTCFTSCNDKKEEDTKVQSVTPSQATMSVPQGSSKTIAAAIVPNSAVQEVIWTSENPAVAAVDNKVINGISASSVTGIQMGSTTVTATSVADPSKKATVTVTVTGLIDSVTVDQNKFTFIIGAMETATIEATVMPTNAPQTVIWTSSNPNAVAVANGVITAVTVGSATITATSTDDPTKTATIAVEVLNLINKEMHRATKFGNGLTVSWVNTGGDLVEFFYTNEAGQAASSIIPVTTQSSFVADFDSGPLSYRTLYFSKVTVMDTLRAPLINLTATIPDFTTFIKSSPAVNIIKPGDFDVGGDGIGFHDADNINTAFNYRSNRGDTQSDVVNIDSDAGNIGNVHDGMWLNYTVDVLNAGNYEIDWYVAITGAGAKCRIEVDGVASADYTMPNSWTEWRYFCEWDRITPPVYHLTVGKHIIRFYSLGAGYNYNGLKLTYKP
jgi:uncharacterized protein YjdB